MKIRNLFNKKPTTTKNLNIFKQPVSPSVSETNFENINLNIYIKAFDDYFTDAGKLIIQRNQASLGMLQRAYKIGFNRASRIMDELEVSGVVSKEKGIKPRDILMSLQQFQFFLENTTKTPPIKEDKPTKQIEIPVIKDFDNLDGLEFEQFCAKILAFNGFRNIKLTQGSGDQGIDILAIKDDIKYGIQCKCYSSDIGNKAVQEAFSGKTYYDCHIAVVLTNRYFTPSAKELAKKNGVVLWDRSKLIQFNNIATIFKESNQV